MNNLTSDSLRLSPLDIDEGRTPYFLSDFPRMTSHGHEPSTLNDYMHWAQRTFDSVRAMLAEERRRQMWTDTFKYLRLESDGGCQYRISI